MGQKSSGSGGEGAVRWVNASEPLHWEHELPTMIEKYEEMYEPIGHPEIDNVVQTWFRVYHSLVLLAAATDPPNGNAIYDYCGVCDYYEGVNVTAELENSHRVPAFDAQEAGCNSGWIYKDIKDTFDEKNLETFGKSFSKELLQLIPKPEDSSQLQPALQYFLKKFEGLSLPFSQTTCLDGCRNSTPNIHDDTGRSIEMALSRIKEIWGNEDDLNNQLDEIRDLPSLGNPIGSELWLLKHFQLEKPIEDLFMSDNVAGRKIVSLEALKLHLNTRTLHYIYHRFVKPANDPTKQGLEEAIKEVSDNEVWQDLLKATYGAIAWHIYRQQQSSFRIVTAIIEGA